MPAMPPVPAPFQLDCFDDVLADRMSAVEWERILAFRSQRQFLQGLERYATLIPDYFSGNMILNKVVTEAWRFEMLVYTLYLYDIRDDDDPRSGLTVSNLQALCAQQQCASRGRVLAILGIMGLGGYLKRKRSERDSRVVTLEPSAQFIDIVEGWNRRIFEIIDAVVPDGHLAQSHAAHHRFGWEMRRRGALSLIKGWKLLDPFPEVDHFVSRDGGWMLLLTCVAQSLRQSAGREITPVSINLSTFGKSFGVSRSHLRRLLETAYAARLLQEPPLNGAQIVLSPHLVASFLSCMASELGFYQGHALSASSDLGLLRGAA
jgi:hypothetical protein